MFAAVVAVEPKNERVVKWLTKTRTLQAELSKPTVATR